MNHSDINIMTSENIIKRVKIGQEINLRMIREIFTKRKFGRRKGNAAQNFNRLFEQDNIETDRLVSISETFGFNSFLLWFETTVIGNITQSAVSIGGGASVYGDGNTTGDVAACEGGSLESLRRENEVLRQALKDKQMIIDLLTNKE